MVMAVLVVLQKGPPWRILVAVGSSDPLWDGQRPGLGRRLGSTHVRQCNQLATKHQETS